MLKVCFDADRMITFADGHHRFRWCSDHGVAVYHECQAEVRRRFGKDSRVSRAEIHS